GVGISLIERDINVAIVPADYIGGHLVVPDIDTAVAPGVGAQLRILVSAVAGQLPFKYFYPACLRDGIFVAFVEVTATDLLVSFPIWLLIRSKGFSLHFVDAAGGHKDHKI